MNLKSPDLLPRSGRTQGRKETWFLFAPLLFCGLGSGVASAQNAEELLKAVRASESKIQLSATQIVQRGGAREVATIYRSGLKRRLEWSAPSVRAGDVLIDDGQTVTLFHRADNTAIQTQSTRRAPVLNSGNWKVGPPSSQDGRTVRTLSRGDGRELLIDTKTSVILRTKGADGVTTLQNVRYGAIPAAKFAFAAPQGVQIVRSDGRLFGSLTSAKRLTAWLQAPTQIPAGYALESVIAGKTEVWLRYSNGKKRFSIFQQKTTDSDMAPQKVNGGWFWRKAGLRVVETGAPAEATAPLSR